MKPDKKIQDTQYIVELTRDEAVVLAMIARSNYSGKTVLVDPIVAISRALLTVDPTLDAEQFALWETLGRPGFQFGR